MSAMTTSEFKAGLLRLSSSDPHPANKVAVLRLMSAYLNAGFDARCDCSAMLRKDLAAIEQQQEKS